MAKLMHETPPKSVLLSDARIAGSLAHRRVDHHEAAGRSDADRLATEAAEHEHPPLARQYPDLIAVAASPGCG
jgi:hypothetical protein